MDLVNVSFSGMVPSFFVFLQRVEGGTCHIRRQFNTGVRFAIHHRFVDVRYTVNGTREDIFARFQARFFNCLIYPITMSSLWA